MLVNLDAGQESCQDLGKTLLSSWHCRGRPLTDTQLMGGLV